MIPLPASFLARPIAHRALHNAKQGRPENSRAAVRAAIDGGYGIEIDVQPSSDGRAMVFHDYGLDRLTDAKGPVCRETAADLRAIPLLSGDEGIPTLAEVLALVGGAVPILIEIKDQDGALGPNVGKLEAAVAADLEDYDGDVAVMSFNPHSVEAFKALAPDTPIGLTTCGFDLGDWPINSVRLGELRRIPDAERLGCSFVSHDARDIDRPRLAGLQAAGLKLLTWTIRSASAERAARHIVDNVTFEGYLP